MREILKEKFTHEFHDAVLFVCWSKLELLNKFCPSGFLNMRPKKKTLTQALQRSFINIRKLGSMFNLQFDTYSTISTFTFVCPCLHACVWR